MLQRWPELQGSLDYVEGDLEHVRADPSVLLTSVHACGPLTDAVLERAMDGGAPVAVMPCCHSLRKQPVPRVPGLTAELLAERASAIGAVPAIDGARIEALQAAGYAVVEEAVDPTVTPYNKLILAQPGAAARKAAYESMQEALAATSDVPAPSGGRALEMAPARGSTRRALSSIPLADAVAIREIAGRRPFESRRAIEVSLWLPEGSALTEAALAVLASRASTSAWRPRTEDGDEAPVPTGSRTYSKRKHRPYWDAAAAVTAARELSPSDGAHDGADEAKAVPVRVVVAQRETYYEQGSRRRACAFTIEFVSSERELTRGEVGMWQTRVREALEWWAADETRSCQPPFELR